MKKNFRNNFKFDRGFTLIELLVVISIIGILSSVVLTSLVGAKKRANDAVVIATRAQIQIQLDAFNAEYGGYPNDGDVIATSYCIGTAAACSAAGYDDNHRITYNNNTFNNLALQNDYNSQLATVIGGKTFSFPTITTFPSYTVSLAVINYIIYQDCGLEVDVCSVGSGAKILAATSQGLNEYPVGTWAGTGLASLGTCGSYDNQLCSNFCNNPAAANYDSNGTGSCTYTPSCKGDFTGACTVSGSSCSNTYNGFCEFIPGSGQCNYRGIPGGVDCPTLGKDDCVAETMSCEYSETTSDSCSRTSKICSDLSESECGGVSGCGWN